MSETEVSYLPVDTSKRGSESRVLNRLHNETLVPVIPPDPEDEIVDSTQIEDQFRNEEEPEAKKVSVQTIARSGRPYREPSTHASRTSDKY